MADLTKLVVRLEAQNTKYLKELDKSKKAANKWRNKVEKENKAVSVSFKQLATGLTAGAAAFSVWFKAQANSIDQTAKLAASINLGTEELQAYRLQAELTGVSQQALDKSLVKLAKNVGDAQAGFGQAKVTLEKLGLANEAFFNLKPGEQFEVIADTIGQLDTAQAKASASAALFGREGVALANTFAEGAGGFVKAKDDIDALGVALTEVDARKIEQANDAFTRVSTAVKGFSQQLAVEFAPIVEKLGNTLFDTAKEAGGLDNIAKTVFQNIATGAAVAANGVRVIKLGFLAVKASVQTFASVVIQGFEFIVNSSSQVQASLVNGWRDALQAIADRVAAFASGIVAKFEDIALTAASIANNIGADIDLTGLESSFSDIKTKLNDAFTLDPARVTAQPSEFFGAFAESFEEQAAATRERVVELANEPLPAGAVFEWVENVSNAAELQAIETTTTRAEIISSALTNEVDMTQRAEDAKTDIQKKAAQERLAFEQATSAQKAKTIIGDAVKITQGVAQQNKALFKINKVAGIANAIVNTSEGITKALAKYPPPLSFAFAALQAAAGFAQVQAIRGQSFSGGGGGTTPSATGASAVVNDTPISSGLDVDVGEFGGPQREISIQFDSTITDTQAVRDFIAGPFTEALGDNISVNASVI